MKAITGRLLNSNNFLIKHSDKLLIVIGVALIATALTLLSSAATTNTVYVSPDGDDKNMGTTQQQAFRSIDKALLSLPDGGIVQVASGEYSAIGIDRKLWGYKPKNPVIVKGQGETRPVIKRTSPARSINDREKGLPTGYAAILYGWENVTIENLTLDGYVSIALHPVSKAWSNNIVINNNEIFDSTGNHDCSLQFSRGRNYTITNNYIHHCYIGIAGPGGGGTVDSDGKPLVVETYIAQYVRIAGNLVENMISDSMVFGRTHDLIVDRNTFKDVDDRRAVCIANKATCHHNDNFQFFGETKRATITNNVFANSMRGQSMLVQTAIGPIDDVCVANNLIYNAGAINIQSAARRVHYIHNTIWQGLLGGLLVRSASSNGANVKSSEPDYWDSSAVYINNIFQGLGFDRGRLLKDSTGKIVELRGRIPKNDAEKALAKPVIVDGKQIKVIYEEAELQRPIITTDNDPAGQPLVYIEDPTARILTFRFPGPNFAYSSNNFIYKETINKGGRPVPDPTNLGTNNIYQEAPGFTRTVGPKEQISDFNAFLSSDSFKLKPGAAAAGKGLTAVPAGVDLGQCKDVVLKTDIGANWPVGAGSAPTGTTPNTPQPPTPTPTNPTAPSNPNPTSTNPVITNPDGEIVAPQPTEAELNANPEPTEASAAAIIALPTAQPITRPTRAKTVSTAQVVTSPAPTNVAPKDAGNPASSSVLGSQPQPINETVTASIQPKSRYADSTFIVTLSLGILASLVAASIILFKRLHPHTVAYGNLSSNAATPTNKQIAEDELSERLHNIKQSPTSTPGNVIVPTSKDDKN